MAAKRNLVGVFLGVGLVLTGPISAFVQSSSTATTGQQMPTDQQGQQMHRHSHHHAHQGGKNGAQPANPQ